MTASTHDTRLAVLARVADRGRPVAPATAVLASAVVATVIDTIIATIAHAAGVSDGFKPLQFAAYTSFTVIGILIGALGWSIIVSRSGDPAGLLRKLVPLVVVVSFVPDILVGITKSQAHTTWGGIAALMVMHLVVAGAAVSAFVALLPPHGDRSGQRRAG